MATAVGEIAKEYEGRVQVSYGDAWTDEGKEAARKYGWDQALHGLVTLAPDGSTVGNLPGHNYGEAEIRAKFEELLARR